MALVARCNTQKKYTLTRCAKLTLIKDFMEAQSKRPVKLSSMVSTQ